MTKNIFVINVPNFASFPLVTSAPSQLMGYIKTKDRLGLARGLVCWPHDLGGK